MSKGDLKKKDKYNVSRDEKSIQKRTFDGTIFSSEMEMKFLRDYLIPLKEKGLIRSILIQPEYVLQRGFAKYGKNFLPIKYVADFEVEFNDGSIVIYEVKGLATETSKVKRKLFDYLYPDRILEWITLSIKYGGWIKYDELQKLRSQQRKKDNNGSKN